MGVSVATQAWRSRVRRVFGLLRAGADRLVPVLARSQDRHTQVATDGSEVSLRAGEYAARLAGGLGAKLFVLHAVDERLTFRSGVHYGKFVEMLSRDGREATGRVRALAAKAGVECEELVVFGRPEQTILSVAEEVGADPIFLGAEGMSKLEHALIGSVSEEALRRANRTVLVVGGHPEEGGAEDENAGANAGAGR